MIRLSSRVCSRYSSAPRVLPSVALGTWPLNRAILGSERDDAVDLSASRLDPRIPDPNRVRASACSSMTSSHCEPEHE